LKWVLKQLVVKQVCGRDHRAPSFILLMLIS
jgi:hypothetical protein